MTTEVPTDTLREERKCYVVPVGCGNDKKGFHMMQSVLIHGYVRLLLSKGHACYIHKLTFLSFFF